MPTVSRILIIEDDLTLRTLMADVVREEGFSVDTVGSGEEALDYLQNRQYDLILTDVILPGINGLEVLRQRRMRGIPSRVIIITGYPTIEAASLAKQWGAVGFLTKPFTLSELRAHLRNALSEEPVTQISLRKA